MTRPQPVARYPSDVDPRSWKRARSRVAGGARAASVAGLRRCDAPRMRSCGSLQAQLVGWLGGCSTGFRRRCSRSRWPPGAAGAGTSGALPHQVWGAGREEHSRQHRAVSIGPCGRTGGRRFACIPNLRVSSCRRRRPRPTVSDSRTLRRSLADLAQGLRTHELWLHLGWQDIRRRYRRSVAGSVVDHHRHRCDGRGDGTRYTAGCSIRTSRRSCRM